MIKKKVSCKITMKRIHHINLRVCLIKSIGKDNNSRMRLIQTHFKETQINLINHTV